MTYRVNQRVQTPIGAGVIQGAWDGEQLLVRLPVNEQTKPQLQKSNCQTPSATFSGLWTFEPGELK